MPVEFDAVVLYVIVAAPWQRVDVDKENGLIVTVGITITFLLAVVVPQSPEAVAVIVAVPL